MAITSHGFWRHAKEFLEAANTVKPVPENALDKSRAKLSLVAYYLVGHSIELSLKAYLYAKGYKVSDLRNQQKFGHDLTKLLSECRRRKLGREVKLTNIEMAAIFLLNETYKTKKFEYLEYGLYRLPDYFFIQSVASKLVKNLARYSMNSSSNKLPK